MSDPFAGLTGHEAPRARLSAALAAPAHAYLLTGPPGSGVEEHAQRFAVALTGLPHLRSSEGNHNLREVRPEGTQIRIEQIQDLWHDIAMRPFAGHRLVYLIWDAHAVPELAQNALLKAIEDTPEYAVVVLVTALPHLLLPTVRSRCQRVPFGRLTRREIADALVADGVSPEQAALAADAAAGDLARARDLVSGGAAADRRRLYLDLARAAYADPAFDPGAAARALDAAAARRGAEAEARAKAEADAELEAIGDAPARELNRIKREGAERAKRRRRAGHVEEVQAAVETAATWYRDVVAASLGASDALVHSDHRTALLEDAAAGAAPVAERALEVARDVRRSLNLTLTPVLAAEGLFHRIWLEAERRRSPS